MEVGVVGYILIPLGLLLIFHRDRSILLYLTVFFVPFTATAVVNMGTIVGLQPAYFFGALFVGRAFVDWAVRVRSFNLPRQRGRLLLPFWIFAIVAVVSVLAIALYSPVTVQRPSGRYERLALTGQNITQLFYVLYATILITCIGLSRLRPRHIRRALWVVLASGIFVGLWGWFQVVCYFTGLPYPDFLFNNSVSFAQKYSVSMMSLGVQRISSVTPEPSMFARFMLIPTFLSFYCVYHKGFLMRRSRAIALTCFFSVTLLASASSTAYAGFIGGVGILLLMVVQEQGLSILRAKGLFRRIKVVLMAALILAGLGGLGIFAAQWMLGLSLSELLELFDLMLFNKLGSRSGEVRVEGALRGLELFWTHPLLGVGWGSNRTFDLTTHVLANTGLLGALSFFGGHLLLGWRGARRGRRLRRWGAMRPGLYLRSLVLMLAVVLFAKMLSEPDIVYLDHWVLVGLLIASTPWWISRPPVSRQHARTSAKVAA